MAKKTKPNPSEIIADPAASSEAKIDNAKARRPSTDPKPKKAGAKKSPAARKTKSAAPGKPSDEEIRLRAYFISERRRRFDLPGDASADWLEAKRQLLSETRPR